jgi:hypothetical protein
MQLQLSAIQYVMPSLQLLAIVDPEYAETIEADDACICCPLDVNA